jgi:hypothetical protein
MRTKKPTQKIECRALSLKIFDERHRASRLEEPPKPSQSDEKYKAANDEIARAIGFGEFIISIEAVAELRRFRHELAKDHESYDDYLTDSMEAINHCLGHMRQIAREDLKGGISSRFGLPGRSYFG